MTLSVLGMLVLLLLCVLYWVRRTIHTTRRVGYSAPESRWIPPTVIRGVLTKDECAALVAFVESSGLLNPSKVLNENQGVDMQVRMSETAWIPKTNPIALRLCTMAAQLAHTTVECCEDMQVVKYRVDGFYKAHHDACCDDTPICADFQKRGGQRIGTLLVYLNDSFSEGETHFPSYNDLKLKVPPGDAIFFHPLAENEPTCHPHALHAGLPITSGVKYVCNIWVRERAFL